MNKKIALSAAIACALALGISQTDTYANAPAEDDALLDSIVITATRTPVEASKANANISVITAEDIEKNHYQDLSDALRSVPGVYVASSAPAGYETSNSLKINGADEVVVVIDGVKMNSAGQKFSPGMIRDMKNIERIEILKGSASVLYGSDAKGGVINIITKKIDENRTTIGVAAGSYDKRQYSFSTEGREDGFTYRISAQKDRSGDFKDAHGTTVPNELDASSVSIKLAQELSDKHEIGFTYDQYLADTKSKALWEQYMHRGEIDNYNWKVTLKSDFDEKTSNFFSYSTNMYDTSIEDDYTIGYPYETKVKTLRISDQFTAELSDKHRLTTGFEFTRDTVISSGNVKLYNRALFLQNEWNITDALKLTTGVRYDNNSGFGDHTTPSINLGYQISDATNVYIGYNEYFIAPSPMHLYDPQYGNRNINAETGDTKEIGINHRFDDTFSASAHLFWRNSENRIGFVTTNYETWEGHYTNVGDEKAHGWDITLNKKFSDTVTAFIGYTHTTIDATEQREANADGYVPKNTWNIGIDYSENKWNATIQGRANVNRIGPSYASGVFPDDTYWVWDIGLNYQADENTKVFAKVNNLLDKFYAENSNVAWGAPGQWYAAPGRNFIMGVEYSF